MVAVDVIRGRRPFFSPATVSTLGRALRRVTYKIPRAACKGKEEKKRRERARYGPRRLLHVSSPVAPKTCRGRRDAMCHEFRRAMTLARVRREAPRRRGGSGGGGRGTCLPGNLLNSVYRITFHPRDQTARTVNARTRLGAKDARNLTGGTAGTCKRHLTKSALLVCLITLSPTLFRNSRAV